MSDSYLAHYGVPRRSGRYPWGSGDRPYQGETLREKIQVRKAVVGTSRSKRRFDDAHTIRKGTIMYRATGSPKDSMNGPKYVTYLSPDRNLYRGGELKNRRYSTNVSKVYEHKMELTKDLKLPSKDEQSDAIKEAVRKNPKLFDQTATASLNLVIPDYVREQIISEDSKKWDNYLNDNLEKLRDKYIITNQGDISDSALPMMRFGMNSVEPLRSEVIKNLSKKGYDGMVDYGGVGAYAPEGIEPLIVFEPKKSLNQMGSHEVTEKEEKKAMDSYMKWSANARAQYARRRWEVG